MNITINGKKEEFSDGISVADLLKARKIRVEMVSVELNDTILPRDKFSETHLKGGDKVEFLYFMGGGVSSKFEVGRIKG